MSTEERPPSEKRSCFVLSPIGEDGSPERKAADQVLRHLVKKSLGSDWIIERADDSKDPGSITPRIIASILDADLIVADLSGHNPNVFYELAIAHGFNKPTVHMQKKGERAPFDVKDMRIVRYDMDPDELEAAQKQLRDYATYTINNRDNIETPLSSAGRFAAVQDSTDPVAESNVRVLDALTDLRRDVARMARQSRHSGAQIARGISADLESLQGVFARVVADDRAEGGDFEYAITPTTTTDYDDWIKEQMVLSVGEVEDTIYDPSIASNHEEYDFDEDDRS